MSQESVQMVSREGNMVAVRIHSWKIRLFLQALLGLGILAIGLTVGFVVGRMEAASDQPSASSAYTHGARILKTGPWGDLECLPMSIAAPIEILPVNQWETTPTHWQFKGYTREALGKLIDSLGLPAADRDQMLAPAGLRIDATGIDMTPPKELVLSLPPAAREKLYAVLVSFPENEEQVVFFDSSLEDHFREGKVSDETVALFKKLSWRHGEYWVFSGFPALLSGIPTYEEKARCVKALTTQNTLLLRLHVTPTTDVNALVQYWGKAAFSTDAKAILDSFTHIPGGAWISLSKLLPPRPSGQLYTYPMPENPANGPPVTRDCNWTAYNFFRTPADPGFSKAEYISEKLKTDYYPVSGDPTFGDVVLFAEPGGNVIHAAVFVADDVVYTKNGATALHPWMLSTIGELRRLYSPRVPAGQELKIVYYRNKYY
jgi:hypothetical protein